MGLAGRKDKQRIGADPRNLTWAQDKNRFGQQYLAKFGWTPDSGTGLGANGEGRLKHITVAQKLNLLGVGNGQGSNGPDSIAWKQNNEFENVLKRLNGQGPVVPDEPDEDAQAEFRDAKRDAKRFLQGFVRGERIESTIEETSPQKENEKQDGKGESENDDRMELDDEKLQRKKRKREKKDKKVKKRKKVENDTAYMDQEAVSLSRNLPEDVQTLPVMTSTQTAQKAPTSVAPRMAHRAKFRASKQLASLSSAALSEILGVSPATSAPLSTVSTTPNKGFSDLATPDPELLSLVDLSSSIISSVSNSNATSTSLTNTTSLHTLNHGFQSVKRPIIEEQLTISSTSVTDYFAAKLKAKKEADGDIQGPPEAAILPLVRVPQGDSQKRDDAMDVVMDESIRANGSTRSNDISGSTEANGQHLNTKRKEEGTRKQRKDKKGKREGREESEKADPRKEKDEKKQKRKSATVMTNTDAETNFVHHDRMHDAQVIHTKSSKTDKIKESDHSSRKKKRKIDTE